MARHGYVYEFLRRLGLSDFAATTGEFLVVRPLKIVLVLLAGVVVSRVGARVARRSVRGLHARSPLRTTSVRAGQRADTIAQALAGLIRIIVMSIAVLMALSEIGLNLAPLLAGAGIAGLAVGFGAQTLVRDFLSGVFILVEDQYGVGDQVNLGDPQSGTVEDVTLRVTRVRGADGTVWFVPNGEIRRVGNLSMEWSKALVDVVVPVNRPLAATLVELSRVVEAFAAEAQWAEVLLEQPALLGVQTAAVDGVTVRVEAKTAPRQQAAVARELRARLLAVVHAAPGGDTRL